jgi:hypothetical protein
VIAVVIRCLLPVGVLLALAYGLLTALCVLAKVPRPHLAGWQMLTWLWIVRKA